MDLTTFKECGAGEVPKADKTACEACGAGEALKADQTACEACGSGKVPNSDKTACECESGKVPNPDGSDSCVAGRKSLTTARPTHRCRKIWKSVRNHTFLARLYSQITMMFISLHF